MMIYLTQRLEGMGGGGGSRFFSRGDGEIKRSFRTNKRSKMIYKKDLKIAVH